MAVLAQIGQLALDDGLGLIELGDFGNHREHDLQRAAAAGAQQRANLAAQQAGTVEAEPDRAPPQRGIFLDHGFHIGQRLVAADVERAERHRLRSRGVQHGAIQRQLVRGARQALADHELQLGTKQPDAGAAGVVDMRQVDDETRIDHQFDFLAVLGDAGLVAQRRILRLSPGAESHPLGIGRFDFGRRAHIDRA